MPTPTTVSGGIYREWFKQGSRIFTHLSETIGLTKLPNMTPLIHADRLQHAKFITTQKGVKRVRPSEESNNSAHVYRRITTFCRDIHADQVYSRTEYDITSYFRSAFIDVRKTTQNAASNCFGSNFSGVAFLLTQPIGRHFGNLPFQIIGN